MKVYIQADKRGMPYNVNAYCAMQGFEQMGFETVLFSEAEELKRVSTEDMVVGGVGIVKWFLKNRKILVEDIDYPKELQSYYKREIVSLTVSQLLHRNNNKPVFVKPKEGKQFNGFVYQSERDLIGRITPKQNAVIYCSEVLTIEEEWRCFVRYGEILDIRRYKGKLGLCYDMEMVQQMVAQYKQAPAGYALDIGVTKQKDTIIVEVNDGYSLGSYGLDPLLYAKLLSARWAELTQGEDVCKF